MKFIASSAALLKHLLQINGAINSNTVLPILEDFLFEVRDKKLSITATDLETVMRVQMDIETQTAVGKVCIPARILVDSLKNISDQPLTFSVDENFLVEIVSSSGRYKLPGEDPNNFPKEPEATAAVAFSLPSNVLLTGINKTLFAVSTDDLRPAMTGVLFEIKTDAIQFVATDAHRLTSYKRTGITTNATDSFIVPKKPLTLLKNTIPDSDDILELSFDKKHFFVKHDNMQMTCRLIDAKFPDYKSVIPTDNPFLLTINKDDFQNALRRVNVFSNKSTNQVAIALVANAEALTLTAQDIDFNFEGNEKVNCQYKGEALQIAFNAKSLIEVLHTASTEEVIVELATPRKAAIIKAVEQVENEELLMLIMPLMLNTN